MRSPKTAKEPDNGRWRKNRVVAILSALAAGSGIAFSGLGCHGPSEGEPGITRGYRILDFTVLGDSALALRIEAWEVRNPPDTAPWPREGFVRLDRKRGTIGPLDTLPLSAAPAFPRWFYSCAEGRPVSAHPPGYVGPDSACTASFAPAISPNGYSLAYADARSRVNLLSRELEPVTYLATRADSVMPLENASGMGRVFVLEWHGRGDTVLWRGFANDDPSGYDSAWLAGPARVRVHEAGIRLACGDADSAAHPLACWSPGLAGFRAALAKAALTSAAGAQAAGGPPFPEWDPATGKLAYLEPPGRFHFADPEDGSDSVFDAGPLLGGYRP